MDSQPIPEIYTGQKGQKVALGETVPTQDPSPVPFFPTHLVPAKIAECFICEINQGAYLKKIEL